LKRFKVFLINTIILTVVSLILRSGRYDF